MEAPRILSVLARQIEIARTRSGFEEGSSSLPVAILDSLRITYLALSSGLDLRKDAAHLFLLDVAPSGELALLQGGQPIPVNGGFLSELFGSAGIELLPDQILMLEPELAKQAVEEALSGVALDQALADRDRAQRRECLDATLTLPSEADFDALRQAEERTNLLWDRKIELIAASLVADEYLERARALVNPEDPGVEAA
ncbi:MAG TPA: hypothetical protein VE981_06895 [Planctomycetota bacterium]|nr:hypothetical protein [Planctomycetota bacterium]